MKRDRAVSHHALWVELCPLKRRAKSQLLIPENATLFGDRVFAEVTKVRRGHAGSGPALARTVLIRGKNWEKRHGCGCKPRKGADARRRPGKTLPRVLGEIKADSALRASDRSLQNCGAWFLLWKAPAARGVFSQQPEARTRLLPSSITALLPLTTRVRPYLARVGRVRDCPCAQHRPPPILPVTVSGGKRISCVSGTVNNNEGTQTHSAHVH